MENQPEPQHHKQQTRSTKAQKWQRDTGKWKDTCHRTDINNDVGHNKSEDASYDQPHRGITDTVHDQE